MLQVSHRNLEKTIMINTPNILLTALIAVILGILGAYFTNWEKEIYFRYLKYLLPLIGISVVLFLFIDTTTALTLGAIFILGLSWYYSTKLLFNKR